MLLIGKKVNCEKIFVDVVQSVLDSHVQDPEINPIQLETQYKRNKQKE